MTRSAGRKRTASQKKDSAFLLHVRQELRRVADPRKAPLMQSYMKSTMPYHGVPAPLLRQLCREVFAEVDLTQRDRWRTKVLELWRGAAYREERYAAIALTGDRRAAAYQTPGELPLYEEIIVTGAWWDYVDEIAARRVGPILLKHSGPMTEKMLEWSTSTNMWKRRTAILCQLGFKRGTNLDLLYACIEPSLDSNEFFLRKAIGWALRQYAWTDPDEVKRYVGRHADRLSGLRRREALTGCCKSRRLASGVKTHQERARLTAGLKPRPSTSRHFLAPC